MRSIFKIFVITLVMSQLAACEGSQSCELPTYWSSLVGRVSSLHNPILVQINIISENNIEWNGVRINRNTLKRYLSTTSTQFPLAFLKIEAKSESCEVIAILSEIGETYPCQRGACGLELPAR